MKKIVVLNETQYKNKELRNAFKTGGFKVVKDKPAFSNSQRRKGLK